MRPACSAAVFYGGAHCPSADARIRVVIVHVSDIYCPGSRCARYITDYNCISLFDSATRGRFFKLSVKSRVLQISLHLGAPRAHTWKNKVFSFTSSVNERAPLFAWLYKKMVNINRRHARGVYFNIVELEMWTA